MAVSVDWVGKSNDCYANRCRRSRWKQPNVAKCPLLSSTDGFVFPVVRTLIVCNTDHLEVDQHVATQSKYGKRWRAFDS